MAVFAGGATLSAVDAVCSCAESDREILEGLSSLVSKSLLVQESSDADPRFTMLESIR